MNPESFAKEILEKEFGYSVEKIAESPSKSPDFLVKGFGESILIELKSKTDDLEVTLARSQKLERGELVEDSDTSERKSTISGIILDAEKQLAIINKNTNFKLIWLMAIDRDQTMKLDQFKSSLYGITTIFDLDSPYTIPCYYYGFNDFFRTSNTIDGAIISTESEAVFCFNTYSPNYSKLKKSVFASKFKGGWCDPLMEEAQEKAMVLDANINRRDQSALMDYLKTKYKKDKISRVEMKYHSATVLVPSNDNT